MKPPFVDTNVWRLAEGPLSKLVTEQPVFWTPEQLNRFLTWARKVNNRYWPAWQFTAPTEDRRSGNLGVRWSDVDLDARTAHLHSFVKEEDGTKRVLIEKTGKTDGGRRYPLDTHTIGVLRHQRRRVAEEHLAAGSVHICTTAEYDCPLPGYHDRGLVFPAADGNYTRPKNLLRELHRAIARYNRQNPDQEPLPDIHVHSLRHAWNSVADNLQIPQAVRMKRMGQTSRRVNDGYTHVVGDADRDAADAVGQILFGNIGESR